MTVALVGAAALGLAGAVLAVSARDGRVAILGLALALGSVPFVADPLPEIRGLALRVVGAALASYLLWIVVRDGHVEVGGSRLGWPAEGVLVVGAAVVGLSVAMLITGSLPPGAIPGTDGPVTGLDPHLVPVAIPTAAGVGLLALAITPVVVPRVPVRLGLGLILLVDGVTLLRTGLAGTPGPLEQLAISGAILAISTGVAALTRLERVTMAVDAGPAVAAPADVIAARPRVAAPEAAAPEAAAPEAAAPTVANSGTAIDRGTDSPGTAEQPAAGPARRKAPGRARAGGRQANRG